MGNYISSYNNSHLSGYLTDLSQYIDATTPSLIIPIIRFELEQNIDATTINF